MPWAEMARIGGFTVDRYEATVVTVEGGVERARSPYETSASGGAKSAPDVVPRGTSRRWRGGGLRRGGLSASAAQRELARVPRRRRGRAYLHGGTTRMPGKCNDGKGPFVPRLFEANPAPGPTRYFNDPRLNQLDGGLARTGAHPECRSPHGVYDCVGNLHEWTSEPVDARGHAPSRRLLRRRRDQREGVPARQTSAHEPTYHDYSTGFRCCRDAR
ncbi:MAG: hypothetical protein IPQ09_30495 [Myxococcales bacterium]|nr:hypothetical protein [Myxococcales bacterium]